MYTFLLNNIFRRACVSADVKLMANWQGHRVVLSERGWSPWGDMPSSVVEGPPIATEQATPTAASGAQIGLGRPVRAQRQPRRAPPRVATLEVEEIVQVLAQPRQVLRTVI